MIGALYAGETYAGGAPPANVYFVGNGTNWSSTASWSLTSGGAPGASVPDATTNVFLDANSPGNLTIDVTANCLNLDCTGFTHTLTVNAVSLTVAGLVFKLVAGMTYTANTAGATRFTRQAASTVMITTAGKTLAAVTFGYNNPSSATFQLQDDLTVAGGNITHSAGTLDTNGKALSCFYVISTSGNTRALIMAGSNVTVSGGWSVTSAGLTFTSTPAQINPTTSITFTGGGFAYHTVNLIVSSTIADANTFDTLSYTGGASQNSSLTVNANQTVTTLNLTANSITNRCLVSSNAIGTPVTFTVGAGGVTMSWVDFMDVTFAGAGAPYSGTSIGDALGNTGITFTPAVTRYAQAAGFWYNTSTWAATSGGVAGASAPLPQDTVIMDATAGAGTYTGHPRLCKDLICTGFTRTLTPSGGAIYGSVTFGVGMTLTGGNLNLYGRGVHTVTTAGVTIGAGNIQFYGTGTYTLQDDFTGAGFFQTGPGSTFNDGGHQVHLTGGTGYQNATPGSTLIMSGIWTLDGTGAIWSMTGTLTATGSTINLTDASSTGKTFAGGGLTYGNVTITAGGTGAVTITGANTFATLTIGAPKTVVLPVGMQTVSNLVARGSAGNVINIHCTTVSGTKATLATPATVGGISLAWCALTDVAATVATWWVDSNTTQTRCTGFTAGPPARTKTLTQAQTTARAGLTRTVALTQAQSVSYTTTQTSAGQVITLTATQSQSVSRTAAVARTLTSTQAQAGSFTPVASRTLSATQNQTSRLAGALARMITISQAQAPASSSASSRGLALTQGQALARAGAVTRTLTLSGAQTVAVSAVTAHPAVRTFATAQAQSGSLARALGRTIAAPSPQLVAVRRSSVGAVSVSGSQALTLQTGYAGSQFGVAQQQVLMAAMGHGARYAYQAQNLTTELAASTTVALGQAQIVKLRMGGAIRRASWTAGVTPTIIERSGMTPGAEVLSGVR